MSHIHWVTRQNKLETPKEKDEVNKREVHECDVRTRNPDAMVVQPTLEMTRFFLFFFLKKTFPPRSDDGNQKRHGICAQQHSFDRYAVHVSMHADFVCIVGFVRRFCTHV
jgi:hypothetical protein